MKYCEFKGKTLALINLEICDFVEETFHIDLKTEVDFVEKNKREWLESKCGYFASKYDMEFGPNGRFIKYRNVTNADKAFELYKYCNNKTYPKSKDKTYSLNKLLSFLEEVSGDKVFLKENEFEREDDFEREA